MSNAERLQWHEKRTKEMWGYTNIDEENKGQLLSFIQFKQGGNRVVFVVQYNSFQILYTRLKKGNEYDLVVAYRLYVMHSDS